MNARLLPNTPSQTVGPFYSLGLVRAPQNEVVPPETEGAFSVRGRVYDGNGDLVPDALIEIWQADAAGEYREDFGWARGGSHPEGEYEFVTVKPGPVEGQAPHLNVQVFGRGLIKQLYTRMYFPEDAEANERDTVLASVPADRRGTLVAAADGDDYRFDIRLQGDGETVFFDLGF